MKTLQAVWLLSICAYVALLLRIFYLGKVRTYPWITTYLILDIICNFVNGWASSTMGRGWFNIHSEAYNCAWAIVNPILLLALGRAVWVMFRRMCSHYLNFGWAVSIVVSIFGTAAVVCALIPLPVEWLSINWAAPFAQVSLMVVRYCHTVLLVFTICTYLFFTMLKRAVTSPLTYRANAIVSMQALIAYIGAQIVGEILCVVHQSNAVTYNILQLVSISGALLWWAASLAESGDTWTPAPVPAYDGARFARLRRLVTKQERRRAATAGD